MTTRAYPTIHMHGATGARAAVLAKHSKAKPRRTGERGSKWPIYAIMAGKAELGRGHGTSDAWEQTATSIYATTTQEG